MADIKPPSKRWRIIVGDETKSYTSEQKAYDVLNDHAHPLAVVGTEADVRFWSGGRWVLYERVRITENGWESA